MSPRSLAGAPSVDVIVPARDCAHLLEGCLRTIVAQTFAAQRVLVVVGPSGDETRLVADRLAADHHHVSVLDNPAGDRASALNVGIEVSTSEWVAMVDAQSRLEPDYLEAALATGARTSAAVVGGPMRPLGSGLVGRAIAAALRSRFGIGDSRFHDANEVGPADSVYLGVYRRGALDAAGPYDADMVRAEDDDMNARVRASGGVIYLDPAIRSTYLCRDSLGQLAGQYQGYGYWKARFLRQQPNEVRSRHLVPAAFVVGLIGAALVSVVAWRPALPVALAAYASAALVASIPQPGLGPARLAFPLATATMHLSYGIGFLRAVLTR